MNCSCTRTIKQLRKPFPWIFPIERRYERAKSVVQYVTIIDGRKPLGWARKCWNRKMTIKFGTRSRNCDVTIIDSRMKSSTFSSSRPDLSSFICPSSLSLHEKLDLQDVEINEQAIIIGELHLEIRTRQANNTAVPIRPATPPAPSKFTHEQTHLIKELDEKLYKLETERTSLVFEKEHLKTNLELALAEKQQISEQRSQARSELKKAKLRILALQDQIQKLKRNQPKETKKDLNPPALFIIKRRLTRKKTKNPFATTKSCLEILLDQNASFMDGLHDQSVMSNRPEHSNDNSFIRRTRKSSISSILSRKRGLWLPSSFWSKDESVVLSSKVQHWRGTQPIRCVCRLLWRIRNLSENSLLRHPPRKHFPLE